MESIAEFLERRWPGYDLPGLAVAVTDRERTLWSSRYGYSCVESRTPIAPGTLFQTGSIGKSFTSIALLQEREAGRFDLHAPVTTYLPWFQIRSTYGPITAHHLLSHTAGIPSGIDFSPDSRSQVWALRDADTAWAPGERFHYSNDGYKSLGLILDAITGRPYAETIQSGIIDPLGMRATHPTITLHTHRDLAVGYMPFYDDRPWQHGLPRVPAPRFETDTADGCLASTLEDMAIYLRMLLNRGRGAGAQVLNEESFDLLTQRTIGLDGEGPWSWYGYGLFGREEDGHTVVGHSGGMPGFVSEIVGDLDTGVGIVWLMNALSSGVPGADRAHALRLARAELEHASPPMELPPSDPTRVPEAAAYAGTYDSADRSFTLEAEGERLIMLWEGERILLASRGEDALLIPHAAFDLFLLRMEREDGTIVGATHGPTYYSRAGAATVQDGETPSAWSAYAGHYRSFTPWLGSFRVFPRHARLWLAFGSGGELKLAPDGEARFTLGPDYPGYLAFGPIVDGQAIAATLTGGTYYRVNTP